MCWYKTGIKVPTANGLSLNLGLPRGPNAGLTWPDLFKVVDLLVSYEMDLNPNLRTLGLWFNRKLPYSFFFFFFVILCMRAYFIFFHTDNIFSFSS